MGRASKPHALFISTRSAQPKGLPGREAAAVSKVASAAVADPDTPNPDCNASSVAVPEGVALEVAEEARSLEERRFAATPPIGWHVDCHRSAGYSMMEHGDCRTYCAVVKRAGRRTFA